MVLWILNLCMIGKASSHRVPISAALGQNACSLLGYEVWWALYMKEVVYWMFSSQRHWGHRILLSTGHQGPAQERVLCFEILLVSMLIICSNQTHGTPRGKLSCTISTAASELSKRVVSFPENGLDLLLFCNDLKCKRKEKLKGFVNYTFEIFQEPSCLLGWRFSNCRLWTTVK